MYRHMTDGINQYSFLGPGWAGPKSSPGMAVLMLRRPSPNKLFLSGPPRKSGSKDFAATGIFVQADGISHHHS